VTPLHPDLLTFLQAAQVLSPSRYVILGEIRNLTEDASEPGSAASRIVLSLAGDLYERLYLRPARPVRPTPAGWAARRDFIASLSAANSGRGTWTPGWRIAQVDDDGDIGVRSHGLTFWASSTQVRLEDDSIEPGKSCWVRVPRELRLLHPGSYFALGDTPDAYLHTDPGGGPWPLIRYFWHLPATVAATFITEATTALNALAVPFRLKLLSDPDSYHRADAGVLYLRREDALSHSQTIGRIHRSVTPELRGDVPLLTFRLAHGLSLAEDPGDDSSFGLHRCTLIAQALWRSFSQAQTDLDARAATLAATFQQHGLDPLHPYLGPGSTLNELLPALLSVSTVRIAVGDNPTGSIRHEPATAVIGSGKLLEAAVSVGRTICRAAVWDPERRYCNWIAYSGIEEAHAAPFGPVSAALGPDLYGGSAGVALFLAELHALTGGADFRETARGAIARSLRQADRRPDELASQLSFFHGLPGLALAADRIGRLIGEPDLLTEVATIVERLYAVSEAPHLLDLLSGSAGAILALMELARLSSRDTELNLAVVLGNELCQTAERRGAIWCWNPGRASGPGVATVPLTGLSHGASGFALALLSLYQATAEGDYLEAARGAFAYEDSLFDGRAGNWPDLRETEESCATPESARFSGGWCHGAPGIALARLLAAAVDHERAGCHRAVARAAIATTLRVTDRALANPDQDLSLCHGLAGLLDILLIAGCHLNDHVCLERAAAAAQALLARQRLAGELPSGGLFPCINPSLMLGLAGTGYALLRLHAPDRVPSVLLLGEPARQAPGLICGRSGRIHGRLRPADR
jgi:hypothetical protein